MEKVCGLVTHTRLRPEHGAIGFKGQRLKGQKPYELLLLARAHHRGRDGKKITVLLGRSGGVARFAVEGMHEHALCPAGNEQIKGVIAGGTRMDIERKGELSGQLRHKLKTGALPCPPLGGFHIPVVKPYFADGGKLCAVYPRHGGHRLDSKIIRSFPILGESVRMQADAGTEHAGMARAQLKHPYIVLPVFAHHHNSLNSYQSRAFNDLIAVAIKIAAGQVRMTIDHLRNYPSVYAPFALLSVSSRRLQHPLQELVPGTEA
jgi:hypothetical protein